MVHYAKNDINNLDRFSRLNLINSVTGYKPANLIGTINSFNQTNLAIISSVVHMGSDPAIIGFFMRPMVVERHTMENILETGFYTINHIHSGIAEKAHFTSADFERSESEFQKCKLTPIFKHDFIAPYVLESKIQIGLQLADKMDISINGTILIIGHVTHIYVDNKACLENGSLALNEVDTVCISGLDTYHRVKKMATYPFARPDSLPDFK